MKGKANGKRGIAIAGSNNSDSGTDRGNDIDSNGGALSGIAGGLTDSGSSGDDTGTGTDADGGEASNGIFASIGEAFGIDSTGADAGTDSTPTRKKRGRPPGSGKVGAKTKTKTVQTSLEGIEGILLSLHMMGAAMLKVPELALSDGEAAKLSEAIGRVAALYDFGASEKTLAWVNLAVCCGGVYGTRLFAYNLRVKAEAEKKRRDKVTPFPMESASPFAASPFDATP